MYHYEGRLKLDVKAVGLGKAKHIVTALALMNSAYRGIVMNGLSRKGEGEKGTNADVKEYLAEGGRDIGPNDEDGEKAAAAYAVIAETFMRLQNEKTPPTQAMANNWGKKAYTAAAEAVNAEMAKRVDKGEDKDGQVIEVTPEYAKWRAKEFTMPDSTNIVLKASGQLLANLQGSGGLKLVKK